MQPRGLTIEQAAEYCGITAASYRNWMKCGRVPKPWPGTRRIDRIALDAALDSIGDKTNNSGLSLYASWKEASQS